MNGFINSPAFAVVVGAALGVVVLVVLLVTTIRLHRREVQDARAADRLRLAGPAHGVSRFWQRRRVPEPAVPQVRSAAAGVAMDPAHRARLAGVDELTIEDMAAFSEMGIVTGKFKR